MVNKRKKMMMKSEIIFYSFDSLFIIDSLFLFGYLLIHTQYNFQK